MGCVRPSTETWLSAITSSSADWVRGEARLISSASRIEVNTGPARNSKVCSFWLNTETPRMSEGSRSGVNCTRVKRAPIDAARLLASVVLPVPGKSSINTWPPEAKAASSRRTPSRLPRMTFSMLAAMRPNSRLASRAGISCRVAASTRSGLLQAPLADGLREGEHGARQRGAVLHRAHHGVRDHALDASRAYVLGAGRVLAVDDEAVDELEVLERDAPRRGFVAQLGHDLAGRALERLAADDRRHGDHRRASLAQHFAHAGHFEDRPDGVVGVGGAEDHRLQLLRIERVSHFGRQHRVLRAGVLEARHHRLPGQRG